LVRINLEVGERPLTTEERFDVLTKGLNTMVDQMATMNGLLEQLMSGKVKGKHFQISF
jgi:hypothetical protein